MKQCNGNKPIHPPLYGGVAPNTLMYREIPIQLVGLNLSVVVCSDKTFLKNYIQTIFPKDFADYFFIDEKEVEYYGMVAKKTIGEKTIFVLYLSDFYPDLICHELIHILWFATRHVLLEVNEYSQEWQALFVEMLFNQIVLTEKYIHVPIA